MNYNDKFKKNVNNNLKSLLFNIHQFSHALFPTQVVRLQYNSFCEVCGCMGSRIVINIYVCVCVCVYVCACDLVLLVI